MTAVSDVKSTASLARREKKGTVTIAPEGNMMSVPFSSSPQLRKLAIGKSPTLLVLYDTIKHWPELLDADAVKVAMYGVETALISAKAAPKGGADILARWHGPRRRLTRNHNRTLSAVGILSDTEGSATLSVYQNYFAAVPIPLEQLRHPSIQHFQLASSPEQGFPAWRAA